MKILKHLDKYFVTSYASREIPILSIQIDITNACNLACVHCYHTDHKNVGVLSLDRWKDVILQYQTLLKTLNRRPSIIICGGEPVTSPSLVPLLAFVKGTLGKVPITLLTNGTIFNPKVNAALAEHESYIQISIDGPNAESHDVVRGAGNFNRALANVPRYQAAGFPVSLLGILSKRTSTQIESFFDLARTLNISRMKFTRFIPEGAGALLVENELDRPLSSSELQRAYQSILDSSRRYSVPTNSNKALFNLLDPKLGEHEQFGFNGVIIDYKGNMKLSSRIPVILGNVAEQSIKDIFLKHPLLRRLRNPANHECGTCPHFRRCGGSKNASWAQLDDLFKKDPGCWIRNQPDTKESRQAI